jgi:hypothetical protein
MEGKLMAKISEIFNVVKNNNGVLEDFQGNIVGGKVLQVLNVNNTDEVTVSDGTTDAGIDLSISFTPISSNSKIFYFSVVSMRARTDDETKAVIVKVKNASGDVYPVYVPTYIGNGAHHNISASINGVFDNTNKVEILIDNNTGFDAYISKDNTLRNLTIMEVDNG